MPNQRRKGWSTATFTAPADLIAAARAKAAATGTNLSAVIREHLERYVKEKP